jgi:hypothetical protein
MSGVMMKKNANIKVRKDMMTTKGNTIRKEGISDIQSIICKKIMFKQDAYSDPIHLKNKVIFLGKDAIMST